MTENAPPTCPDCKIPMESGRLTVQLMERVVQWCRDAPESPDRTVVEAFRCPRCGLVRNYA